MTMFKKLKESFGSDVRPVKSSDEFIEVDVGEMAGGSSFTPEGKIGLRIENLSEFKDTEKVLKYAREGSIVMLKIKSLKEKDLGELKRAVERMKKTIIAQSGEIVGIEQDWLLLVPSHVTVHR